MIEFQILTPWQLVYETGDGLMGGANFIQPQVASQYALSSWQDVTGQPANHLVPEPNLLIIQAQADLAVFSLLENDPNYFILWSKEVNP